MTDDAAKAIRNLVDQGKSLSEAIKQVKEVMVLYLEIVIHSLMRFTIGF